jgi:hypothetical protein
MFPLMSKASTAQVADWGTGALGEFDPFITWKARTLRLIPRQRKNFFTQMPFQTRLD